MSEHSWVEKFPGGVTVCDARGIIVEMNERAAATFQADGGKALVGKDLRDCHPVAARARLEELLATKQRNVYTIRKNGVRKLIYQSPLFRDGAFAGIVELSLEIPFQMPEFDRG